MGNDTKILVLGSGFIGKPLAEYLNADVCTKRLADITAEDLDPYDIVINAVAKTKIDWCEKNREETLDTNVTQAVRIAKLTKGKYVFFSSACIFKSDDLDEVNYEDSRPNPQCFYTYTKLMAEQLLQEVRPEALIIRPRLLISEKPNPRNTLDKLLTYDKLINTQESVTVLEDLLPKVKSLLGEKGAFNVCNAGTISPSELMKIFGHPHKRISKNELDAMTCGQARRVSTVVGSMRTVMMPNIWDRIYDIKEKYNGQ